MAIVVLNQPYYYNQMLRDMECLEECYPSYCKCKTIGISLDNRMIHALYIGKNKPCVILTAGVHGRESVNPAVLMGMTEYYCSHFEEINFFQHNSLIIVPMVNPDGYMIALKGLDAINTKEISSLLRKSEIFYPEWKYNARGIDINRNFPSKTWNPLSGTSKPGTEPETAALMHLFDQEDSIGYIDYHSRGDLIYYYRNQMDLCYNKQQESLAKELKKLTGYRLAEPQEETEPGDIGGNTVHYYSEVVKMPAITIETLPDEMTFPLSFESQKDVFRKLYKTPFVF